MTVEEKLKKMLFDCGLFENQCDVILERVKVGETTEAMEGRWEDAADGYPDCLFNVLWLSVKRHALEYIDETCPNAWFRPMFTPIEIVDGVAVRKVVA